MFLFRLDWTPNINVAIILVSFPASEIFMVPNLFQKNGRIKYIHLQNMTAIDVFFILKFNEF